ncbi:MAG: flagellar biosynthetic protein FliQ [Pirellulales bacterium]
MQTDLVEVVRQAMLTGFFAVTPTLIIGFVVAACVGIIQAALSIHEPLVGLVPRLVAMAFVLLLTLPWMIDQLVNLMRSLYLVH